MGATEDSPGIALVQSRLRSALTTSAALTRVAVYVTCTIAAVVTNYLLGKEMMWDTLDYHLYAGFSALHDRFNQDYFAAGPQAYFNPYIYVPFYLLATAHFSALIASTILAVIQSANLWLTYELSLEVVPSDQPAIRVKIAICAVLLAFLNPILISQFGSSYADIMTGELVLGGWLLLARAIRCPGALPIALAGALVGAASALKLTNSAHALSAVIVQLFVPATWQERLRRTLIFVAVLGMVFVVIAAPWAVKLEHQFGNPVFPLLNSVFHSPDYTAGPMLDHRFMPDSLAEALWRPFAIVQPMSMVDNELPSPDLRYALLLILGVLAVGRWGYLRFRGHDALPSSAWEARSSRVLTAFGCGLLLDWALWLSVSGNGRYFIPMACIAAVLAVALVFKLFGARPKVRAYLLLAVFSAQILQLSFGSAFRPHLHWDSGPWFELSVPKALATKPSLYFAYGELSNSFVAPFLAPGSGLINIGGGYELRSDGANRNRIDTLLRRYAPRLRVMIGSGALRGPPDLTRVDGELAGFDLRTDPSRCSRITVTDAVGSAPGDDESSAKSATGYLLICALVRSTEESAALAAGKRAADKVFDRLEKACPRLFYPPNPVTQNYSSKQAQVWVRRYPSTGLSVYIGPAGVQITFGDRGGTPARLGRESDWEGTAPRLACGRENERYYARLLPNRPRKGSE